MKKVKPRYKLTNLVITNNFARSLAFRFIDFPLYLILFIYFSKSGAAPSPCAGPVLAWLRLYNTPKIDNAKSSSKKTIKLQPLNNITALGLFNVITGVTKK